MDYRYHKSINLVPMRYFILLCLFALSSVFATAQDTETASTEDPAMVEAVNQFIEASGAWSSYEIVVNQMIDMQMKGNANIDPEFTEKFRLEMMNFGKEELGKMMVPIYSKYFTPAEMQEIVAFYQTPIGKKLAEKTPLITQESMMGGQQLGQKIATKILNEMSEKKD